MNEIQEKTLRIQNSLVKLIELKMNLPQILCNLDAAISEETRTHNILAIKAMAQRIYLKSSVVIPGVKDYKYLTKEEFLESIKDYNGEAILIYKSPKSFPLVTGVCEPAPYFNKLYLGDSNYNIIWGDSVLKDFPTVLKRPINDLNAMLQRGRTILDGMPIRFTFHPQGEGLNSDRIVLWGMNA